MKLNQLRDLMAIVERGSLRAAARHLNLPQPSLTRSLQALEKDLGAPLFERESKGMVLTPIGQLFHQRASAVLNELQRAREEVEQIRGKMHGTLSIGLSFALLAGLLPQVLSPFRLRFPDVKINVIEGAFPAVEAALRDRSVDFYAGPAPMQPPGQGFNYEPLFHNSRTVVCRRSHPCAHARSLRDLNDQEWAVTSLDYNATEDLERLFLRHGLAKPRVMMQSLSVFSVMLTVASSDLLAILPMQWSTTLIASDALTAIEVEENLDAPDIVLISRSDLPLTPAAEYFCDLLRRSIPRDRAISG
ncbi:LysR substrate-binding domain-containing protein [Pseudomonas sp. NCCP-436]|uniref:LysR substrate-binding domain-containing protein n=1 Tax=Pseudomonas sp. NCCP-436 TaxID=2842481 RepID=UPI001C81EA17|nr:LysR substrate-binding domain-containing protein [Pseudomonas sp. NCCP-436]GIZ10755.1 LysR family transcriptional regulator [Pseudomonas sp. NCCP-436]